MPPPPTARRIEVYRDCEQVSHVFPPGHQLFAEGELPEGVFLLSTGSVKLFSTARSRGHRSVTLLDEAALREVSGVCRHGG